MTATMVVCPECGSPVAPGRLSCQSCGTLLASVVGSTRPPLWAAANQPLPEIDEDRPLAFARRSTSDMTDAEGNAGVVDIPAAASDAANAPAAGAPVAKRAPRRLPRPKVPGSKTAPATPVAPAKARYVRAPRQEVVAPADQVALFGPVPSVSPPILHDWADPVASAAGATDSEPAVATSVASAPAAIAPVGPAADTGPVAGSYLAPSATYVAPIPAPGRPNLTAARNGASAIASAAWPRALEPSPPVAPPAGNGRHGAPTAHSSLAGPSAAAGASTDTNQAKARGLAEWLIIGGATLAIVSFLLPWATDGVIGSSGAGYTADWGLANPGHLLLIFVAAAVLIIHLVDGPLPAWFRSGVVPLLIGGTLAGLAFAYYARPAGGGAGVAVLLAGAVVLIVGGALGSRPERNAASGSSV